MIKLTLEGIQPFLETPQMSTRSGLPLSRVGVHPFLEIPQMSTQGNVPFFRGRILIVVYMVHLHRHPKLVELFQTSCNMSRVSGLQVGRPQEGSDYGDDANNHQKLYETSVSTQALEYLLAGSSYLT